MKIQEALDRIRNLKNRQVELQGEMRVNAISKRFVGVHPSEYKAKRPDVDSMIKEYVDNTQEIERLRTKVQETNVQCGTTEIIQRLDVLKSLCIGLKPLLGIQSVTDPDIAHHGFGGMSNSNFPLQYSEANFDVDELQKLYKNSQGSIVALETELKKMNWETELIHNTVGGLISWITIAPTSKFRI